MGFIWLVLVNPDNGFPCKKVNLCHTVASKKRRMSILSVKNLASNLDKALGQEKGSVERTKGSHDGLINLRYSLPGSECNSKTFENT